MLKVSKLKFLTIVAIGVIAVIDMLQKEANGAEIYSMGTTLRTVVIEGTIERGDCEIFRNIAKSHFPNITKVVICSSGGDFYESMKIGRLIRQLELETSIPDSDGVVNFLMKKFGHLQDPKHLTCASAAFFIHAGGVIRRGDIIFVHSPYIKREYLSKMSKEDAAKAFSILQKDAADYMNEMGVPKPFQEYVFNTPSDTVKQIPKEDINILFSGFMQKYREWIASKVDDLTQDEKQKLKTLRANRQRTVTENEELMMLSNKEYSVFEQMQNLHYSMTLDAYTKVFGEAPSDHRYHKFELWTSAVSYLGKSLLEINNEERFGPIETAEVEVLGSLRSTYKVSKSASGVAPRISVIGNSKDCAGYVSITQMHPSREFSANLLQKITSVWGKPDYESEKYLRWEKSDFFATLNIYDNNKDKPSVDLSILGLGERFGTRRSK
jgi:hypothetical protein